MRRFVRGLTGFLRAVVLWGAGVGLLAIGLGRAWPAGEGMEGVRRLAEAAAPWRVHAIAGGVGLILLELLHGWTRPRTRRSPDELTFRPEGGPVISLKTSAVREAIARVAAEFDCVEEMRTEVSRGRGGVDLDLTVRVAAGTVIPVLCTELQNRAREVVAGEIGLFDLREVRVHVEDWAAAVPRLAPVAVQPEAPGGGAGAADPEDLP